MENSQITITDLANLRDIIDVAASRGAFRADEFNNVGDIYSRLNNFLKSFEAQGSQTPADGQQSSAEDDDELTNGE